MRHIHLLVKHAWQQLDLWIGVLIGVLQRVAVLLTGHWFNAIFSFFCSRWRKSGNRRANGLRLQWKPTDSKVQRRRSDSNHQSQLRKVFHRRLQRRRSNRLERQLLHAKGQESHLREVQQLWRLPNSSHRLRLRPQSVPRHGEVFGSPLCLC